MAKGSGGWALGSMVAVDHRARTRGCVGTWAASREGHLDPRSPPDPLLVLLDMSKRARTPLVTARAVAGGQGSPTMATAEAHLDVVCSEIVAVVAGAALSLQARSRA
jgi:hypothetical protein